jgi:sec-independent protein translocase protein TatA
VISTLAFLPNIGPLELGIVLLIVIMIFGPKRIPEAFRSIGDGFRGFRDTVGGEDKDDKDPAALNRPTSDEDPMGTASRGEDSEADEKSAAGRKT